MAAEVSAAELAGRAAPEGAARSASLPPPQRFHCRLDDQPGFLVPFRLLEPPPDPTEGLIVNPHCWFARFGTPPPDVSACAPLLENFDWDEEAVCVGEPRLRMLLPFSMGRAYREITHGFRPGHPPPAGLGRRAIENLTAARILIHPAAEERRREEWLRTIERVGREFRQGYATVAGLIHPFHLGALRRYYRYLIRNGRVRLGDGQSPLRFAAHNESATRFFHRQLTSAVSVLVGEPVKPSYVYFASYQGGAELPRHTDRPQCEFSISMLIDASPEPEVESGWPIHLDAPRGWVSVYQAIGDGLLYRGRALPHYRDRQDEGATSTSLFFHFVSEGFDGALE